MTDNLTGSELEQRKANVVASNHALGRVLSIIGVSLAVFALLILLSGGAADTVADISVNNGADRDSFKDVVALARNAMLAAPGLVLLFAMCALVLGEQLRRGQVKPNPNAPDTLLPSASNVSDFAVLSYRVHAVWVAVGLAVSAVLVGIPVISWFTGSWPSTVRSDYDFTGFWIIYGAIAFGITVATAVSLLKKALWVRRVSVGTATRTGGPGKRFWRWVDYRWRFDIWLAGIGGLLAALSLVFLDGTGGEFGTPALLAAALPPFVGVLAGGVLLIVLGALAAAQFWRSGEALGSGESLA